MRFLPTRPLAWIALVVFVANCGGGTGGPAEWGGGDPTLPTLLPRSEDSPFGGVNNGDLFDESPVVRDRMLNALALSDLRVVRILLDYRLEMDDDGNATPLGTYNDCILEAIDDLMLAASERGVLLLITFQVYNWISGTAFLSRTHYDWRTCKTPENVYNELAPEESRRLASPYSQRGWGHDYLTNPQARSAYKMRVSHVLNHVNPHFGLAWKDLNEVVWAWGLTGEIEYVYGGTIATRVAWLDEMATYVKSIDPDTYVALGTKYYTTLEAAGCLENADVYTLHPYDTTPERMATLIDDFNREIGRPCDKLLLVEEFNPSAEKRVRTPNGRHHLATFEGVVEACRRKRVSWMFWEHGYHFDSDDIWHGNDTISGPSGSWMGWDGVFWGAKVNPGATKTWLSASPSPLAGKPWRVHAMVDTLCAGAAHAACRERGSILHLDTFSGTALGSGYRIFDQNAPDSYTVDEGYLRIGAGVWQDLWGTDKRGAPLALVPLSFPGHGDDAYVVETFVRAGPLDSDPKQPLNTQTGLFVFEDVDNWIFFGLSNHDVPVDQEAREQGDGLIVTSTQGGVSQILRRHDQQEDYAFLAIKWFGATQTWHFLARSEYDVPWQLVGTLVQAIDPSHEVGVGVKTFDLIGETVSTAEAHFDYLKIATIPEDQIPDPDN